ncbi:MAG: sigma factor-like helix-turn-helix DNA-binding protein, partial [Dietzia sp.]|uniref:sigma factor-like helix-turn-helix DNA-binding protein n=1 Tax=Dietzia sp. TaxID=1871616 RepID=UPI0027218829
VGVAHRRAVDVVRRSARMAAPAGGADEVVLLEEWEGSGRGRSGGGWSGNRAGDDDELGDHPIWCAVAALPTRQRLSVAYRYLGGLPYAEIAALIGGSDSAARRAAADGVAALRQTMETTPTIRSIPTIKTTPTIETTPTREQT